MPGAPPKAEAAAAPAAGSALSGWPLPSGWRSEVIAFPLGFAPTISHRGAEEIRFPPGFFNPAAGDYWSYTFVWRTEDSAQLDAAGLESELTTYFRGLTEAVDEKKRIKARDEIAVRATPDGATRFALAAHVFDAFKTAAPLDLVGTAERRTCGTGALWVFVLAPAKTSIRPQLEDLARVAVCGQ